MTLVSDGSPEIGWFCSGCSGWIGGCCSAGCCGSIGGGCCVGCFGSIGGGGGAGCCGWIGDGCGDAGGCNSGGGVLYRLVNISKNTNK